MHPAVDTFLKTVLRSGLLDAEQLKAAYKAVPRAQRSDPPTVADHLVRTGKLTRFQAGKLLRGTAIGLQLGPYQVLAPIGKGGMGTVYLARDGRDERLLALKVLSPRRAREQEHMVARFRREMDLCLRVTHPHLAQTFEVGVELGVYFIAMEFIPGKDLSKVVLEQGPLPVPRAARLFAEVAAALQYAHEQGLVHRDLKPSNIRVTPTDHVKVLDLGLALMQGQEPADREPQPGRTHVVGSMDYIAPEQTFDSTNVDARADLYGMGCALYFALTGRPPFPGAASNREKIQRHRNEEPALLTERNPDVPPRFAELVHRLMAKKPERRYPSAEAVRKELLTWAPPVAEGEGEDTGESVSETEGKGVKPQDQLSDTDFRQAVVSLQEADPDPDPDEDWADIPIAEPWESPAPPWWLWISIGFVAAWVLLMLGVVLYFAFR